MLLNSFEGWYFKHQIDGHTIAFIPGRANSGPFIQVIGMDGSAHFDVPHLRVHNGVIYAGNCVFSYSGSAIDLPGIKGKILYGPLTPLKSDIMGPFRFLPMECRHSVISMRHSLSGTLVMGSNKISFDGGTGYIEKDSGVSFPKSYLWLQCNDLPEGASVMLSIADIPFAGMHFIGCICAIVHDRREYRLATYRGVNIVAWGSDHVCLTQGNMRLEIDIQNTEPGHPLKSPVRGAMAGIVRENNRAMARIRLYKNGESHLDLQSQSAGFEYLR